MSQGRVTGSMQESSPHRAGGWPSVQAGHQVGDGRRGTGLASPQRRSGEGLRNPQGLGVNWGGFPSAALSHPESTGHGETQGDVIKEYCQKGVLKG